MDRLRLTATVNASRSGSIVLEAGPYVFRCLPAIRSQRYAFRSVHATTALRRDQPSPHKGEGAIHEHARIYGPIPLSYGIEPVRFKASSSNSVRPVVSCV